MSKPVFITFRDTLINVEDISYSELAEKKWYDPDKPWSISIIFKGGRWLMLSFKTEKEARTAATTFHLRIDEALMRAHS